MNKIFNIDKVGSVTADSLTGRGLVTWLLAQGRAAERRPGPATSRPRSSSSGRGARSRSCSVENCSTYTAERGRKCGWRREKGSKNVEVEIADTDFHYFYQSIYNNCEVEVAFEDPDTGDIIRETVEVVSRPCDQGGSDCVAAGGPERSPHPRHHDRAAAPRARHPRAAARRAPRAPARPLRLHRALWLARAEGSQRARR